MTPGFASFGDADALLLACAPALAIAIDRLLGEPALRWHPVAWMGRWLAWAGERLAPRNLSRTRISRVGASMRLSIFACAHTRSSSGRLTGDRAMVCLWVSGPESSTVICWLSLALPAGRSA